MPDDRQGRKRDGVPLSALEHGWQHPGVPRRPGMSSGRGTERGRGAGRARRAHTYRLLSSGRHGDGEQRPSSARLGGCRLPGGLPPPPLGQLIARVAGESRPRSPAQLPPPPARPGRLGPAAGPQPPRRRGARCGAQAAAPPHEGTQGGHGRRSAPVTGGHNHRRRPKKTSRETGKGWGRESPRQSPPPPAGTSDRSAAQMFPCLLWQRSGSAAVTASAVVLVPEGRPQSKAAAGSQVLSGSGGL